MDNEENKANIKGDSSISPIVEAKARSEEEYEQTFIDPIDKIILIKDQVELENKIFENTINIIKFLKNIDNKLYEEFNLSQNEIKLFIKCLKFIDTLNLFMNQASINNISKILFNINDSLNLINNISSKEDIIYQIRYTEKSFIYYKKAYFKSLFFNDEKTIYESFNEILDENSLYDFKTFKQIQNLFYVFSMKLTNEVEKEALVKKKNYLKTIILPFNKKNYFSSFGSSLADTQQVSAESQASSYPPKSYSNNSSDYYKKFNNYNNYNNYGENYSSHKYASTDYYDDKHDKKKNYYNDNQGQSYSNTQGGYFKNYSNSQGSNSNNSYSEKSLPNSNSHLNSFQEGKHFSETNNYENTNQWSNNNSSNFGSGNQVQGNLSHCKDSRGYYINSNHKYIKRNQNGIQNNIYVNNNNYYSYNIINNKGEINLHGSEGNANFDKKSYPHSQKNVHNNPGYNNHHQYGNNYHGGYKGGYSHIDYNNNFKAGLNQVSSENSLTPVNNNSDFNEKKNIESNSNTSEGQLKLISKFEEKNIKLNTGLIYEVNREKLESINDKPINLENKELIDIDVNKIFEMSTENIFKSKSGPTQESKETTKFKEPENNQKSLINPNDEVSNIKQTNSNTKDKRRRKDKDIQPITNNLDINDFSDSFDSKSIEDEMEELEDDSDLEEEEEEDEEEEFNNFIRQDIEDQINHELYSQSETKNDKIIFGNETKGKTDNENFFNKMGESDPEMYNTEDDNKEKEIKKVRASSEIVVGLSNIENSTPYIPISHKKLKEGGVNNEIVQEDEQKKQPYSHQEQVMFKGKDSSIHKEYFALKLTEQKNPKIFETNLNMFEDLILNPVYQKISVNVYKKKIKYFLIFSKYKNIIYRTLNKSKLLKKVKPYGSYVNNFLIDSGDIDICIVPKGNIMEFAGHLEKIKQIILEKDIGEFKLSHYTERYSLLKIMDKESQFIVDITVHNMLPILNSKLVKLYSQCDQRFHIMGIYLKHWAKINKIHGAADNYLSSYALLNMLIFFLQKVIEPKILPNLQKVDRKEKMYSYIQSGAKITTNIFFEENPVKIKKELDRINNGVQNNESTASLLVKFFEYYSYYFENHVMKISISDDQEVFKEELDNYAFSMVDPFDPTHNPGRSLLINSTQFNKFTTAMKKEINFILSGEYIRRLDSITSK